MIMSAEQKDIEINNDLDFSIKKGTHQVEILAFLRNNLPVCTKMLVQEGRNLCNIEEDAISREISHLLDDKLRESSGYLFGFEPKEGPDILIYALPYVPFSQPLLVIEAKRLRLKSSNDYVKTGIRRFKTEEHGEQHNIAAMLGYVQENDFDYWFNKVNLWIIALISKEEESPMWSAEEQISKIQMTDIGEYKSKHPRITKGPITLHHFWINLCNNMYN